MDALRNTWGIWSLRIDALSFRERVLVFLAAAGVMLSVMFVGLIEPALKRQEMMLQNTTSLQQEVFTLREQVASEARLNQSGLNSEQARLRAEAGALEREVRARERGLISPARMIAALKTLIGQQSGLTLLALETASGKPVPGVSGGTDRAAGRTFFKHAVTLRLQGGYADLTAYVARLESLPWTVQWESVSLDASQHPRLVMTLKLNTLSLEPTWARL